MVCMITGEMSSNVEMRLYPHSPHKVIGPKSTLLTISSSCDWHTEQIGFFRNVDMATSSHVG